MREGAFGLPFLFRLGFPRGSEKLRHVSQEQEQTTTYHGELLDINTPEHCEIEIREDGKVVWISIDGLTKVRICRIKNLYITDNRPERKRRARTK